MTEEQNTIYGLKTTDMTYCRIIFPNIDVVKLFQKANTTYHAINVRETSILNHAHTKRSVLIYNLNSFTNNRKLQGKDRRLFKTGVSFKLLPMCI